MLLMQDCFRRSIERVTNLMDLAQTGVILTSLVVHERKHCCDSPVINAVSLNTSCAAAKCAFSCNLVMVIVAHIMPTMPTMHVPNP